MRDLYNIQRSKGYAAQKLFFKKFSRPAKTLESCLVSDETVLLH
jgi:hypothetical protein